VRHYAAPWGKLLTLVSLLTTLVCIGASFIVWHNAARQPSGELAGWTAVIPMLVLVIALLFMVRGYEITPDEILVERLLWRTSLRRSRLQSATADPGAMTGAIRVFGNGGLFSFTGLFRSRSLGKFRAYVTDPARAVVLRFPDRVVVVSPANPEVFARDVMPF
jgi:Bacterial PH domain